MNLHTINPLNNNVLLKVKKRNDRVELKGGEILYIDTSFEPEKNANVICEVVKTPENLIFGYSNDRNDRGYFIPKNNSMDWETKMELRVGDEVIIHFNSYASAFLESGKNIEIDGQEYFFCDYSNIFLAKRKWTNHEISEFWEKNENQEVSIDDMERFGITIDKEKDIFNVIPLNGYCLVEPIEKEITSKFLEIPKSMTNTDKKRVKICYNGSDNTEYLNTDYSDASGLKFDDVVIIAKHCDIPLEYNETLNGKRYWRVQKCLVQAVINK